MDIPARCKTLVEFRPNPPLGIRRPADGTVIEMTPERWTSTCLQCGRVIRADNQCGRWWRHLPEWIQACVLTPIPVGTVPVKYLLQHKTTGYYAVIGEDAAHSFRHSPNVSEATAFDTFKAAEICRRDFDSFSDAWFVLEVSGSVK